ncbi:MAG: M23 family metallopeptidase [Spirochaetia bacterium]|nr:M23 family metallopeptidase [Spirochaetia bacterium]
MQIISYVGSAPKSRGSARSKSLMLKFRSKAFKRSGSGFMAKAFSGAGILPDRAFSPVLPKVNFRVLLRPERLKKICIFSALVIFVPYFSIKLADHIQSFTGPLQMAETFSSEIENLNTAMAKFAMASSGASFDENGNVLSDDGKVLTPSSVGVAKAVSFQSYRVKSGDTISSIALNFGLTNISTLISVNGIDNVRTLMAGQKIRIPNQDGIVYTIQKGDSLNSISIKHRVSVEEIVDANELADEKLSAGGELFIPGARMDSASLKKAMGELFICPISQSYRISSYFGRRQDPFSGVLSEHTGVDLACPTGTPINATMSGKIVKTGWTNIFGNYVIINHGNGYQTLYAHMSKILCRTGQSVSQGTRIGLVGSTGYSTGPHLHFTVYKNGRLVDPLSLIKR